MSPTQDAGLSPGLPLSRARSTLHSSTYINLEQALTPQVRHAMRAIVAILHSPVVSREGLPLLSEILPTLTSLSRQFPRAWLSNWQPKGHTVAVPGLLPGFHLQ